MALQSTQATPEATPARDEGFTLVEVIWALFLLGLISLAALGLFVNGMKSVAHVQRQQAAVSLANSAMDLARSVSGGSVDATATSGLVKGRSLAAVKTVWDAATAANAADTADMKMESDPASGLAVADQWVPVRATKTVDNQTYTVDTLVGKCYRLRTATSLSQNCLKDPGTPPTNYIETHRVRVVVRWDEGSDATGGSGAHTYSMSTLIDPSADATWNTDVKPFAYDDEATVPAGASTFLAIVANDSVTYNDATDNPVKTIGAISPSVAGASVAPDGTNGVLFTAPNNASGTVKFTYYVQGSSGAISAAPGTVTVHIVPVAVNDMIYVAAGSTTTLNTSMLSNDLGVTNIEPTTRKTTIVPVEGASSLSGKGITFDASGNVIFAAGSITPVTFTYYLVDDPKGSGIRYPSDADGPLGTPATVTLKVDPPMVAPAVNAPDITVAPTSTWGSTPIDWKGLTGNATASAIQITGVTSALGTAAYDDNVFLDGKKYTTSGINKTGALLTFNVNKDSMGLYVLTYKVAGPSGTLGTTSGTITVKVLPLVKDYTFPSKVASGSLVDLTAAGIVPTSDVQATPVTAVGNTCTAAAQTSPNQLKVKVTFLGSNTRCVFTYKLITNNATKYPTALTSSAMGTITVNKQ